MADKSLSRSGLYKRKRKEREAYLRLNPRLFESDEGSISKNDVPRANLDPSIELPDQLIIDDPMHAQQSHTIWKNQSIERRNNRETAFDKNIDLADTEDNQQQNLPHSQLSNQVLGDLRTEETNDSGISRNCEVSDGDCLSSDDRRINVGIEEDRRGKAVFSSQMETLNLPFVLKEGIMARDFVLGCLAKNMRHHSPWESLMDDFKWMNIMLYDPCLPISKGVLWNKLQRNDEGCVRYLYCQHCRAELGIVGTTTRICGCPASKKRKKVSYYLSIDLEMQIKEIFSIPNIASSLQYRFNRRKEDPDGIEDIYDGEAYKKLCQPGDFLSNKWNFSFTFNIDSVQVSKSSKSSVYPIWVQINELSPHARKRHMLLAGLWIDEKHPVANNFVSPFVNQLKNLYTRGIVWKPEGEAEITSKFICVIFNADSPARCEFLRMKQFNGKDGCTFCYAEGVTSEGPSNHSKYPVEEYEQRSDNTIRADAQKAMELQRKYYQKTKKRRCISYKGVKGPSRFGIIPRFNLRTSVVVEIMHNGYLGVLNHRTTILTESPGKEWYIGAPTQLMKINERLLAISPPSRISRYPRRLQDYKSYKASEWRNWGYYCIPCLKDILLKKYLEHLSILCEVLYIYNQSSMTAADVTRCDKLVVQYLKDFEKFFGIEAMVFNLHLLGHCSETVRNWGPSWAHNAFAFESMNRRIIQNVTSPNGRLLQIYSRFLMNKFLKNCCAFDDSIREETRNFIMEKLRIIPGTIGKEHGQINFTSLSRGEIREPTDLEREILSRAGYQCPELMEFEKARIQGIEYRSCEFHPETKFSNSTIFTDDLGFGEIKCIIEFKHGEELIRGIFIRQLQWVQDWTNTTFLKEVAKADEISFLTIDKLRKPAIQISISGKIYVMKLPNVWETD